jgi:general secretion pathway protein F
MTRYRVRGLRSGGELAVLALDAEDEAGARRHASEQGLSVVSIAPERASLAQLAGSRVRFSLLLFTQEFVSLLEAGLGAREALEALAGKSRDEGAATLRGVLADINAGLTLSQAFERAGNTFPPLFVATVRASERTGDMQMALARYGEYLGQVERLRGKVTNALVYPVMLALVGAAVSAFLLLYVVPRFGRIYDDMGRDLPFLSRILMKTGELLSQNATVALAATAAAAFLGWRLAKKPAVRERLTRAAWATPRIGEAIRLYHLAQFYRSMGMLLKGGMPIVPSLGLARDLLAQAMRPGVDQARARIAEGIPASVALSDAGLATSVALSLLRVGEKSGQLGDMMERVAIFHDAELARRIELATRLFEPLLMAAIGVVIGVLVVLLYLPVFELANSLQ